MAERLDRAFDGRVPVSSTKSARVRSGARGEQVEAGHALHLEIGQHEIRRRAPSAAIAASADAHALDVASAVPERVADLLARRGGCRRHEDAFSGIRLRHRAGSEFSDAIRSRAAVVRSVRTKAELVH